uniref:Uncharacterized protein n=1 Tax=Anguilla anguilla TaxID=7936 RepID=A0A0E9PEH5_ANGAN
MWNATTTGQETAHLELLIILDGKRDG